MASSNSSPNNINFRASCCSLIIEHHNTSDDITLYHSIRYYDTKMLSKMFPHYLHVANYIFENCNNSMVLLDSSHYLNYHLKKVKATE